MKYLIIATFIMVGANSINCQGIDDIVVSGINQANVFNNKYTTISSRPIEYQRKRQTESNKRKENLRKADSIIGMTWVSSLSQFINYTKDEFEYDLRGNMTVFIQSEWQYNNDKWGIETKFEYSYNNSNYLEQEVRKYWSPEIEDWIPYRKYVYELSDLNKLTNSYWYDYNSYNNDWINDWKISYEYDEYILLIKEHVYKWDTLSSFWTDYWKNELNYDSNQNLIVSNEETWHIDSNEWILMNKNEYFYNQSNKQYLHIFSHRLNVFDPFRQSWRNNISYDTNELVAQEYYEDWFVDSSAWIPMRKDIYGYYENSKIKTKKIDLYNNLHSYWYNDSNYEYIYDNNLNLVTWLDYYLDNDSSWSLVRLIEFNYDYMNDEFIIPDFADYPFDYYLVEYFDNITNEPVDYLSFNNLNDTLRNSYLAKYYFSNDYAAIEDTELSNQIFVFPNPASEIIKFNIVESDNIENIKLYNQIGQPVFFKKQVKDNFVDVKGVKPGIYILEANINNTIIRQKVIIK